MAHPMAHAILHQTGQDSSVTSVSEYWDWCLEYVTAQLSPRPLRRGSKCKKQPSFSLWWGSICLAKGNR